MAHTGVAGRRLIRRPLAELCNLPKTQHLQPTYLLLLEAWETNKPMHPGIMLRIRQIRRANPQLSTEIAAELTMRRKATTDASHH
jgi:hypothetical protein